MSRWRVGRRVGTLALGGVLALVLASPSSAQTTGEPTVRPNRALFGSGRAAGGPSLVFAASVGVGRDDLSVPPLAQGAANPSRVSEFASGSAALDFSMVGAKVSFSAGAISSARHLSGLGNGTVTSHAARANLGWRLSTRTAVNGNVGVTYEPLSVTALFPGLFQTDALATLPTLPTAYDLGQQASSYVSDTGMVEVTHLLTRRTQVAFGYVYGHSKANSQRVGQRTDQVSGRLTRAMGRGLAVRLGYGRRVGRFGDVDPSAAGTIRQHTIDAGVDYSQSLSFSRRTHLSFSTGSAAFSDGVVERYDLTGSANLRHQWGRSWSSGVTYARDFGFLGTLVQPTLSNSLSATVNGLLTRRFSVDAGVGVSDGGVGLSGPSNGYRAYRGSAGIGGALNRFVAFRLDYVYFTYDFDSGQFVPLLLGTQVSRQSVQASVNLSMPLISRGRSSNATR